MAQEPSGASQASSKGKRKRGSSGQAEDNDTTADAALTASEHNDNADGGGGSGQGGQGLSDVAALAEFQRTALLHAMTFPNVDRIVYSTCSVFEAEDEDVVAHVLQANPDWTLVPCMPTWHGRGRSVEGKLTADQAQCVVRVDPYEDQTCGFFVALFARRSSVVSGGAGGGGGTKLTEEQLEQRKRRNAKKRARKKKAAGSA